MSERLRSTRQSPEVTGNSVPDQSDQESLTCLRALTASAITHGTVFVQEGEVGQIFTQIRVKKVPLDSKEGVEFECPSKASLGCEATCVLAREPEVSPYNLELMGKDGTEAAQAALDEACVEIRL